MMDSTMTYDHLINKLIEDIKEKTQNSKCTICMSNYDEDKQYTDMYVITPCGHIFHDECIKSWLENYSYKCPVCRSSCGPPYAKMIVENQIHYLLM